MLTSLILAATLLHEPPAKLHTKQFVTEAVLARWPTLVFTEIALARNPAAYESNPLMRNQAVRVTAAGFIQPLLHIWACREVEKRKGHKAANRLSKGLMIVGLGMAANDLIRIRR